MDFAENSILAPLALTVGRDPFFWVSGEMNWRFTPLEIMDRYYTARLYFKVIPAGFNVLLKFLTGLTL
jgi:hypothetical protein